MNAAGQALVEFVLLMAIFLVVVASIAKDIPLTFKGASPYLAMKLEQRLQTGAGFGNGQVWQAPKAPKFGVTDNPGQ